MKGFLRLPAFIVLVVAACLCFPAVSRGEEATGVRIVETDGIAAVIDSNLARARDEAVQDALGKAVARAAETWLSPRDAERNHGLLKEHLYDRAEGFVRDFRILFEVHDLDIYSVTVRATVLLDGIRKDLQRLGLTDPADDRPPLIRVSLILRGIRDYGEYVRWREILSDRLPGIRAVTLRSASWGAARLDADLEGTIPAAADLLREKFGAVVLNMDEKSLEVYLK